MKFATVAGSILAAVSAVSAGTFYSPTSGEAIPHDQPFNFTWDAGRYDKESSNYVTVTLQPAVSTVTAGINLIEQLASNGTYLPYGSQKYSAQLPIIFEYSAAQTGNYTLTVLENYNAYGGNRATAIFTLPITLT
ncbi:hypothetical protein PLICRDRAFT_52361 [Plicaturopsis crispa FD-325 SS-3]|nr:hypothetical protein PLICRDRAFT_52361 [Plicaturopsis crispa FD-325 SS-3]